MFCLLGLGWVELRGWMNRWDGGFSVGNRGGVGWRWMEGWTVDGGFDIVGG